MEVYLLMPQFKILSINTECSVMNKGQCKWSTESNYKVIAKMKTRKYSILAADLFLIAQKVKDKRKDK